MEGKSLYAACSLRSLGRDPFVTGLTIPACLRCPILLFDRTWARVSLSLNFGLAANSPKRDGCHGCPYPNLGNTNYVEWEGKRERAITRE